MDDPERIRGTLNNIRKLGIKLSMDDFGTGHSSLSCLHHFPIDYLKIDRSFVQTGSANQDYASIIHAIIVLAHNLDALVIAEGVEREDQLAQLTSLACDYAQGFLIAPAISAEKAIDMLRNDHARRLSA
jgi:EAL domain-containing protein (putative c-di-GMP-specific phosphodiesterase class I)